MDYTCDKKTVQVCRTVFESCTEQSVERELSLPEEVRDIRKVLKCQVIPQVEHSNLSGERVECGGTVRIRILYLENDGKMPYSLEEVQPFTASLSVKGLENPEHAVCDVRPRLEFVSCTLSGPRRVSVRGSFSLCLQVMERQNVDLTTSICGDDVQQRVRVVPGGALQCLCCERFPLSETLELGSGKPPMEAILRSRVQCLCEETRVVSDSILLRGRVMLEVLYVPGNESPLPEKMEFSIPFSQMIEAPGAREDGVCTVEMRAEDPVLQPRSDNLGENTRLEMHLQLTALVRVYREEDFSIVEDAYSTVYATTPQYQNLMLPRPIGERQDSFSQTATVESGSELLTGVIDLWNEITSVGAQAASGQLVYTGKLNVCLLAVNREGTPFYREKVMDFSAAFPAEISDGTELLPLSPIVRLQYRILSASSVEVRADLQVRTLLQGSSLCRVLQGLGQNGEELRTVDTPLVLYFAQNGERLWDIAKRYGSSVQAICEENEIPLDCGPDASSSGMLLIPM